MPAETRLPTGTVSFLFTDIETSTRLWEAHPEEMRVALASHDAIFREIVPERRGVIFKTVGDAICAAFERAEDALYAAVDAQRRLATHPWPEAIGEIRVRMGIHSGTAQERDDDYFGRTVNRVARFSSIAHGGQVLVSGSTAALLRHTELDGITLRDLGEHRLKDLAEPEHTYQVVCNGLRLDFPPPTSLDSHPNNLPSHFSSFVGRDGELSTLRDAVGAHRIITIAGPGGIGKTRLAVQLGAELANTFKAGVWFVEMALLDDPALIPQTVADVLHITEQPTEHLVQTIVQALSTKQILLILDNSEHLLVEVAAFVRELAHRCPSVHVLVTSREPLHMPGEYVYRLLPLSVSRSAKEGGLRSASEQLFLERALTARPDLVVDDATGDAIRRICRHLDGMPLAIELAAARVTTLALSELDQRLADRLKVLVSRDQSVDNRHRTLRATIEWSYRLLNDSERAVARALAVFSGSFTLPAVEFVIDDEYDALDHLESLVDKSLVAVHGSPEDSRFIIYDTIREYLLAEMNSAPAEAEAVRLRHLSFFQNFLNAEPVQHSVSGQSAWLERVSREINDVRSALEWAAPRRPADAVALLIGLARYWQLRSHISEGFDTLRRMTEILKVSDAELAPLLRRAATFATIRDDYTEARRLNIAARDAYERIGDVGGIAEATFHTAVVAHRVGDDVSARRHYTEALAFFRAAAHHRGAVLSIMNLSMMALSHGHLESAEQLVAEAISLENSVQDANLLADLATVRGSFALQRGDYAAALACYQQAVSAKRELGNRVDVADLLAMMAEAMVGLGELDDGARLANDAVDIGREAGSQQAVIQGLEVLAELACRQEKFEEAARALVTARDLREKHSLQFVLDSTRQLRERAQKLVERKLGSGFEGRVDRSTV